MGQLGSSWLSGSGSYNVEHTWAAQSMVGSGKTFWDERGTLL